MVAEVGLPDTAGGHCLVRGGILHFPDRVAQNSVTPEPVWYPDGLLHVVDGRIRACIPADQAADAGLCLADAADHRGCIIMPGFIDAHVHASQLGIIGSFGEQLIDWLEKYTFPEEARFAALDYARCQAGVFVDELVRNGTTTALAFATSHAHAVEALFAEALKRNLRFYSGQVLMDRNAPPALCINDPDLQQTLELIERWHGTGRLGYAITPRFAPTSTAQQLHAAGHLFSQHPDLLMQTHLSETRAECDWVSALFPDCEHYTDVYQQAGLLSGRSLFGHGIHLADAELELLAGTGSSVVFCPASNLFLGSGLCDVPRLQGAGVTVGLGSDVGAGTHLSMLRTMADGYKVMQLQGSGFHPFLAFYLATLGNARALGIDQFVGSFDLGKEADFIVVDAGRQTLLRNRLDPDRLQRKADLQEQLFAMMTLGDDRLIRQTYVFGRPVLALERQYCDVC